MSLKKSWQQQRQQRQQEVMQRQQQVRTMLTVAQRERQIKSAQLRDELSLFRESIVSQDQVRRQEFQQFQTEMQLFCVSLQTQMQSFLAAAQTRRHQEAAQIAEQLDAFMHQLRQQVKGFLTIAAADRTIMAHQLEQSLNQFVQALKVDVQSYLCELEIARQARAEQLNQELAQSRMTREMETAAMFQRLAEFRAELQEFCANLRHQVWGEVTVQPKTKSATKATVKQPSTPPANAANKAVVLPAVPLAATVGLFPKGDTIALMPPKSGKPAAKDKPNHEKDVLDFICKSEGARLTEIESSLGINRFQAVGALQALIQQHKVTQRDRVYLAVEKFAHN